MARSALFRLLALSFLVTSVLYTGTAQAQIREHIEPPELPSQQARTPFSEGLRAGMLMRIGLTDNGMSVGVEYRKVLAPYTDFQMNLEVGGIRDSREQVFTSYFGQITPNKYNRVAAAPVMLGLRQRLFANAFDDGFRLNFTAQAGPTIAFVYPYFDDVNGNGIRDNERPVEGQPYNYDEYYDVFRGWKQGDFTWGGAGRISMGVDFGDRFKRVTAFEFGYQFQYFKDGIQIMQPNRYEVIQTPAGPMLDIVPAASKQSFFGSPVITVSFGRFW